MRVLRIQPVLLFLPLLAACSSVQMPEVTSMITPYKIDIRQGNYVSQEMIAQLKQGMTRDQVRFILGTPLVTDIFHADRWDYVYSFKQGRGDARMRRFAVYFVDDKLARLSGDVEAESPAAAAADAATNASTRNRVIEIGNDADEKKKAADAEAKKSESEATARNEPKPEAEIKPAPEPASEPAPAAPSSDKQ